MAAAALHDKVMAAVCSGERERNVPHLALLLLGLSHAYRDISNYKFSATVNGDRLET